MGFGSNFFMSIRFNLRGESQSSAKAWEVQPLGYAHECAQSRSIQTPLDKDAQRYLQSRFFFIEVRV